MLKYFIYDFSPLSRFSYFKEWRKKSATGHAKEELRRTRMGVVTARYQDTRRVNYEVSKSHFNKYPC